MAGSLPGFPVALESQRPRRRQQVVHIIMPVNASCQPNSASKKAVMLKGLESGDACADCG